MEAAKLKEILSKQYGINSEEEFNMAVEKSAGINIGIFTTKLNAEVCETEQEVRASA